MFDHAKKPNPLAVEKKVSSSWPTSRNSSAAIPQWPDAGESGNVARRFRPGAEFFQPCFHLVTGEFVGIEPQDPVVGRLFPSERPVGLLLMIARSLEKTSAESFHHPAHASGIPTVMHHNQVVVTLGRRSNEAREQLTLAVDAYNQGQGRHV
jgi:hypothetical protein